MMRKASSVKRETSNVKRRIRTVMNVRDLSSGRLIKKGEELELEVREAERWVDARVAEYVNGELSTKDTKNTKDTEVVDHGSVESTIVHEGDDGRDAEDVSEAAEESGEVEDEEVGNGEDHGF